MKQLRNTFVWLALFSMCGILFLSDYAQSFRDDFDVLKEKNWEHWGEFSIWKVENGYLKNWIQLRPDLIRPELLQFKGLPGPYENIDVKVAEDEFIQRQIRKPGFDNFEITVKNMGQKRVNFGIAIGWVPEKDRSYPYYYLFMTSQMVNASFTGWGGFLITGRRLKQLGEDLTRNWDTQELTSMEIRFNSGHIQWYANGEKRADFVDPDYSPIEILGIVVIGNDFNVGHAWMDSFKISGPGLSVSPQAKLATTWGTLKQLR